MATPSDEQRVTGELTEERLVFIETHFNGPTVLQLVAEVRAGRARESAAALTLGNCHVMLQDKDREIRALQQRIDKALAWLPAPGVDPAADAIRATLAGARGAGA